jgi:hypothetical protein
LQRPRYIQSLASLLIQPADGQLEAIIRRLRIVLAFQVDQLLQDFIGGGDHPRRGLEAALCQNSYW